MGEDTTRFKLAAYERLTEVAAALIGVNLRIDSQPLRGRCPFCIGNTINFRERIATESAMAAFFVFFPSVLDPEAATVNLPDRTIHIVGMYPIYEGEIDLIQRIGPVAFWDLDGFDPYDVHRPDLSRVP